MADDRFRGRPQDKPRDNSHKRPNRDRREVLSDEGGVSVIFGRNPVTEAIKADKLIDTIYVNNGAGGSIAHICSLARQKGIVVKSVDDMKLESLCGNVAHQGIVAVGAPAEYSSVEDILAISKEKGTPPFIIICDEIEDPHNLGAIIRTAETSGADGVIIPKRRSASLGTVYKTSAGAASWVPVARVPNIPAAIDTLKENGVWVFGTDADGTDYCEADFRGAVALVIGSEGKGIGRLVREKCDFLLRIPMAGRITSLNASVAAGIFMYEVVRQRRM